MRAPARTVGALLLLQAALPANLLFTAAALLRGLVVTATPEHPAEPKTVLISGGKMTKALQLARSFHRAGHRVILVESHKYRWTGHRFSRAVDRFYTVPEPRDAGYVAALTDVVLREGVDVYVPVCSPVASQYDAQAKEALSQHCEVLHVDPATLDLLDDKYAFAVSATAAGLAVPETHRITKGQQVQDLDHDGTVGRYILKSIGYDPVWRLDLTRFPRESPHETVDAIGDRPISVDNPWILQEFVAGQEYCTHSTVRDGRVQVYCCCISSAFQVNYEMVDKPEIETWVREFVRARNITGQVSFDFIEATDGRTLAIECNPRTHSAITMFYNHPDLARAYLDGAAETITPLPSSRPTYWLYHELWRILSHPASAGQRLRVIARGKEAIFDWSDPLPFLLAHHLQIPWLLVQNLRRHRGWIRIDFNIGKLVEPAGD